MSTPFIHRNLPRLLLQAREAVMAHTRPNLREQGLSDQQWRVLRVLGEHGVVETGRVAREAFIVGPSLTGVLARMERDGLIRRARDPEDQRRTVVEATAKGMKLVGKLSLAIEAHYDWMEQQLGKQKLSRLYELLDEVIEMEQPGADTATRSAAVPASGAPVRPKRARTAVRSTEVNP